jgi:hypothetical protein
MGTVRKTRHTLGGGTLNLVHDIVVAVDEYKGGER